MNPESPAGADARASLRERTGNSPATLRGREPRPPSRGHARRFRRGIPALLFLMTIGLAAGCAERSRAPVLPGQPGKDLPDQESWNAIITFTDSGHVTGVLRAGYIGKFLRDKYTLLDSGITVDFFNEQHEHTSVLTAHRGRVNDATNDFEAWGNVVVRSDSGTVLKTEELLWNNKRERVHTEAYVEIISPTEEIRGEGLESDQSLRHYTIRRVTGQVVQK